MTLGGREAGDVLCCVRDWEGVRGDGEGVILARGTPTFRRKILSSWAVRGPWGRIESNQVLPG